MSDLPRLCKTPGTPCTSVRNPSCFQLFHWSSADFPEYTFASWPKRRWRWSLVKDKASLFGDIYRDLKSSIAVLPNGLWSRFARWCCIVSVRSVNRVTSLFRHSSFISGQGTHRDVKSQLIRVCSLNNLWRKGVLFCGHPTAVGRISQQLPSRTYFTPGLLLRSSCSWP